MKKIDKRAKNKNGSSLGASIEADTKGINSRMFLASTQCAGSKGTYLFAFGGEV